MSPLSQPSTRFVLAEYYLRGGGGPAPELAPLGEVHVEDPHVVEWDGYVVIVARPARVNDHVTVVRTSDVVVAADGQGARGVALCVGAIVQEGPLEAFRVEAPHVRMVRGVVAACVNNQEGTVGRAGRGGDHHAVALPRQGLRGGLVPGPHQLPLRGVAIEADSPEVLEQRRLGAPPAVDVEVILAGGGGQRRPSMRASRQWAQR
eukprot:624047-Prorocentrum_minimum.AAC.1